jgi:SAM-dependent methyltransferase
VDRWEGYDAATYGDRVADVYDDLYEPDPRAVACLADLAGPGPVLELGIGTGRLALPLAAQGLEVHGIDASHRMVARLRAKPGGDRVAVTVGDFNNVAVEGRFSLVFVAFNTLFGLLDPNDQGRCFENVATHLALGGRFVVEAFVPDPSRFVRGQSLEVTRVTPDGALLNASRHDAETQRVDSLILWVFGDGVRTWPGRIRYSYPAELDEMASATGLRLEHRWSDWNRAPFVPNDSEKHVSVYVRSANAGTPTR